MKDKETLLQLFCSYLEGDATAFDRFWQEVEPRVRRYIHSRFSGQLGSGWCDDVVQETLWRMHQARHSFVVDHNLDAQDAVNDAILMRWILQIGRNHALDRLRRQQTEMRVISQSVVDDQKRWEEDQQDAENAHLYDALQDLIQALPPSLREVVIMHSIEGFSMAEIATRLGLREGAIRTRASRAYTVLRDVFKKNPADE